MVRFFRQRWCQVGLILAGIVLCVVAVERQQLGGVRILLCVSLITLFIHQFEEYRLPGYFPRMINTTLFDSREPERFPLNANTALIINVLLGWSLYVLAIAFADKALWLATATIVVSAGNVVAHLVLFNVKGKTRYNPGMASAALLFVPMTIGYFAYLQQHQLLRPDSLVVGICVGALINYFGIFKLIGILSDKESPYPFEPFR
jgi:hypothetical protein